MSASTTVLTAPNRFVEASNGVTYAYRRLGPATEVPCSCCSISTATWITGTRPASTTSPGSAR
jgi:hypothetical protein